MDKQSAVKLIRETFEKSFDKEQFVYFIKNLFNKIEIETGTFKNGYYGQFIPESFKPYIKIYKRIGKYNDGNNRIDVLIVYLEKEKLIERARTMQRNFIGGYLNGKYGSDTVKDAALVAFISPNQEDWRFSLVKMEYKLTQTKTGRPKGEEEFTPAKRFSFLVGRNEPNHTAQSRLYPLLKDDINNPTLTQLEEAFNIEIVTKEFFEKYRDLFIRIKEAMDNIVNKDPAVKEDFTNKGVDTVDFAKKSMGQIVFLYFLQKKGWFGVEKGKDWGTGSKRLLRDLYEGKIIQYKNFFNDVLEPLFYDALARDRSDIDHYNEHFKTKIPFLNGGLFDPINNYDWVNTDILLSDELFSNRTEYDSEGTGILDVFDLYNFTVREDEPLEKEVAIDPELLGKAYEKFNAIRHDNFDEYKKASRSGQKGAESKFNKQYGVYYTPREIVHYMCQQSLINYLVTEMGGKVSKEAIEFLILSGEKYIEYLKTAKEKKEKGRKSGYKETKHFIELKKHATDVDGFLSNIKVCDPAIGSGAFPVGMMTEIIKARLFFLETKCLSDSYKNLKGDEIKRNVYNYKRDYIQNSLYGVDIDPGAVEIAKLRLWLSLVVDEEDIKQIKPLPNLDYKIVCGNSLLGVEENVFNAQLFTKLEGLKPLYFDETNSRKKQEYKEQIKKLIKEITNNNENFDFKIYFSEVFHKRDGFDVVIANPPYVGEKGHKEIFKEVKNGPLKKFYLGKMDYFYFFFHLSLNIAKQNSNISFITTNYYPTAMGAKKLRQDFKERAIIRNLMNFNELKIFESALGQHNMITILEKAQNDTTFAQTCITQKQGFATSEILCRILNKIDSETHYYRVSQKDLYDGEECYIRLTGTRASKTSDNSIQKILDKIKAQGISLGIICNVNQGIVTGADKVSKKHIEKYGIKAERGDGIFVLSDKEISNLNFGKGDREILKPWFKNSDIFKWRTSLLCTEKLIYADKRLRNLKNNKLKEHLQKFKKVLDDSTVNSPYLHRPRNIDFDSEKIVAPQRSPRNTFGYNEIPWYASADVYFITEKDKTVPLKYVLALLNSKLYYLWLYYRGKRKGETLELYQKPLSEIPIKKISKPNQEPFINLVDNILTITKDDDYLENPAKQAKVCKYEKQIDQLVYKLYGLTDEEIKIVEGQNNDRKN